jgi:hypothetical protein
LFRVLAAATAIVPLAGVRSANAHWWWGGGWKPPKDGGGGHMCVLRGTAIRTERGAVAVEQLAVGDRVLTQSGAFRPIKGIGRTVHRNEAGSAWDESIAPVRIARSAIAANVPERDLCVSPEHAFFFDGHLIPAKLLVNGVSITQDAPTERDIIDYYHIVLDRHDVMYAEGAAVESLQLADVRQVEAFDEYRSDGSTLVAMAAFAPLLGYHGGRQEAVALARLAVSPFVDVRDRVQIVYDRLAARAKLLTAGEGATARAA